MCRWLSRGWLQRTTAHYSPEKCPALALFPGTGKVSPCPGCLGSRVTRYLGPVCFSFLSEVCVFLVSYSFCIRLVIYSLKTSDDTGGIHILNKIKLSKGLRGDEALYLSGYSHPRKKLTGPTVNK